MQSFYETLISIRQRQTSHRRDETSVADHEAVPPEWSACYAPHSSMYFDQFGRVRACCQNTGVYMGDVSRQSLREIWESAEAERIRTALEANDYSAGCDFCEWQVREGNGDILFARQFDELMAQDQRPLWPRQMEFSLTNTCNLACVMCSGDLSSTIRSKREGRPPIPEAYGEAFYEQLAEFLPHLVEAKFLGGEPFLGSEPLRVMEMLGQLENKPRVTITTNGTIYTDRVRRVIGLLDPYVAVSIDGASAATFDSIRLGAHFDQVIGNIDRFREDLGPGRVTLAFCLMTANWHEFSDLLRLAQERDISVGVNVVRSPAEASLYQLKAEQLAPIVAEMSSTETGLTGQHLQIWEGHVAALTHRLDAITATAATGQPPPEIPGQGWPSGSLDSVEILSLNETIRNGSDGEPLELLLENGVVTEVDAPASWEWLVRPSWYGATFEQLLIVIESSLKATVTSSPRETGDSRTGGWNCSLVLPNDQFDLALTMFNRPDPGQSTVLFYRASSVPSSG